MKISAAITTFNEEKHIGECIKSLYWVDEVIVVDGTSTDKTVKIAKELGAKVFVVPNKPLMKLNMNLSFEKCKGEWILQVDADERVTEELAREIKDTIKENRGYLAYRIPRKNMMFGKWMEYSGWYPDYQLRLFRNGMAKYPAKNVHEDLEVNGTVDILNNPILHLNWETVGQFLLRLDSYTTYEAEKLISDEKQINWTDAIKFPVGEFLSRFFDRQGYKDGLHGLVLSLLMAFYWEIIFVKIWETQGFADYKGSNFLGEVKRQVFDVGKQWNYWAVRSEKNYYLRILMKVGYKFLNVSYGLFQKIWF